MCPKSKVAYKFHCTFEMQKAHHHIPPVRPIISGSGSSVENPSKLIDYHFKDVSTKYESYIQDTPDFIRQIEEVN